MTLTDPYQDPKQAFLPIEYRGTLKDLDEIIKPNFDFEQPTEIGMMDVEITNLEIILKDRPKNAVYLLLKSPLLKVSQSQFIKGGRFPESPQTELAHQNIKTEI